MEKVLDIDNIFDDTSFVASLSNGEEETSQISKARSELSSRLATIFANDDRTVPKTTSPVEVQDSEPKKKSGVASSATILSGTVYLYLPENGQYVSKGRVGVAVVRSNLSVFLIFYNSNKEKLLSVPLGDGKIYKIDKQEKYCIVTAALKNFSFVCLNADDEAKLIASLMILCSIKSTVLDVGAGDEVKLGSSIHFDSTKFALNGTAIEVVAQQPSKHRLSSKSDSSMSILLGLKKFGKCLVCLDDKTALAINITKVKNTSKKRKSDISNPKLTEEELSHHSENIMADVSNVETSENENSDKQQQCLASLTDGSFPQFFDVKHDHSEKSGQLLNDYSVLHRIVGVEIDRLEDRLQISFERMVNGCMNSIKNEMIQIKEKQDLLLEKLEDLRSEGFSR